MTTGTLTVTGNNSTLIPLSGRPCEVFVLFKHDQYLPPCNPRHPDVLEWRITFQDEEPRLHKKLNHHHHDRLFFLFIEWQISGIREIEWIVIY